uniref:DNK domain-containing protein n=2 Tax=Mesocestoides corti TaxID=53468 RepID=A0A5K3EU84_MESCO
MEENRTVKVAVEGNIGCGKSTFLRYFEGISPKIQISPEPIEKWNDVKGYKLFEVFYGNPTKWSTPFQSQVMVTLLNRQAEQQTAPVRILERSVNSSRLCFIEAMNRNKQMSDGDLAVVDKYYEWGKKLPCCKLDLIVYLRCSPEVCAERIRKRDRKGESSISMDYLHQLHDLHEDWLLRGKSEPVEAPVLVFDCDEPLEILTNVYYERRSQVLCGVPV